MVVLSITTFVVFFCHIEIYRLTIYLCFIIVESLYIVFHVFDNPDFLTNCAVSRMVSSLARSSLAITLVRPKVSEKRCLLSSFLNPTDILCPLPFTFIFLWIRGTIS